jgi:hypothetical protein
MSNCLITHYHSPALHILPEIKGPLLFLGKVTCCNINVQDEDGAHNKVHNNNDTSVTRKHRESVNNNSSEGSNNLSVLQDGRSLESLAVSDTGHNRIIVFNTHGRIEVIAVHTFADMCLLEKKKCVSLKLQNCTSAITVIAVAFVCACACIHVLTYVISSSLQDLKSIYFRNMILGPVSRFCVD